jgi:3-dehydroquinate dehydratase-1
LAGKICVSIATTGDVSLLKEQVDRAFSLGADFAEIRFDFVSPNRMQAAIDAVRGIRSKAVFTLRSKDQGGKFAGSEQERLDVELDTIKENDDLADFLGKAPILISWHDFQQTPPSDELADILSEMRIYSNYVKVVTTAKSVEDSLRLLELYESTTGLHPVIFAMGDAGIVSRILCTIVGNAPFTYTSLEKAVAPGQLTVMQMRKLYDRIASGT